MYEMDDKQFRAWVKGQGAERTTPLTAKEKKARENMSIIQRGQTRRRKIQEGTNTNKQSGRALREFQMQEQEKAERKYYEGLE